MERWICERHKAEYDEWAKELNINPVCASVLGNRGVADVHAADLFLHGTMNDMHDPYLLPDMDKAVDTYLWAIENKLLIASAGDYDVDGVTATTILVKGTRALGGESCYAVPKRVGEGYGLNERIVREFHSKGVKLLLTCDNGVGIEAHKAIALAYELGMKVIVTDHHQIPFETDAAGLRHCVLPKAEAVVDPHREDSVYPFKDICGAMVAYKFMQAVYQRTLNEQLGELMSELAEFATFGTVCDIMPLLDENRYLVREGLIKMENTSNVGLRALISACKMNDRHLDVYALGYILGPCVNASGRLGDALDAVNLFLSEDKNFCARRAQVLQELNAARKAMTDEGLSEALRKIKNENLSTRKVLVVYLPELHESVAGLVAGKLKERFHRPVLVVTRGETDLKGSGRSISAYNMFEKLHEVEDLFIGFGGHALAAGFSLKAENLNALSEKLEENAGLTDDDVLGTVHIDALLDLKDVTSSVVNGLERLAPYGTGNAGAVFMNRKAEVIRIERLGRLGLYGKFTVSDGKKTYRMTYFGDMDAVDKMLDDKYGIDRRLKLYGLGDRVPMNICYSVGRDDYHGKYEVDYRVRSVRCA